MRQLLNVVHQAIQMPLRIHLGLTSGTLGAFAFGVAGQEVADAFGFSLESLDAPYVLCGINKDALAAGPLNHAAADHATAVGQ